MQVQFCQFHPLEDGKVTSKCIALTHTATAEMQVSQWHALDALQTRQRGTSIQVQASQLHPLEGGKVASKFPAVA